MQDKIPCTCCGVLILPATAGRTGGLCMPCNNGTRDSMDQSREFYKKQREYDPYRALWESLVERVYGADAGLENLSEDEKTYYYVGSLDGEIYNGGFHQFFSNSAGDCFEETRAALVRLNASSALSLLEQARMLLFGEMPVPRGQVERNRAMPEYPEDEQCPESDWSLRLSQLDDEYYRDTDRIGEKLENFARQTGLIEPFIKSGV